MQKDEVFSEKLKGIEENCLECRDGTKMISTGYLQREPVINSWYIIYECPVCKETMGKWDAKYESLIQEVLKEEGIEE